MLSLDCNELAENVAWTEYSLKVAEIAGVSVEPAKYWDESTWVEIIINQGSAALTAHKGAL